MKTCLKYIKSASILTIVMLVICGLAYPAVLTGAGQLFFPHQANGSLITSQGEKTTNADKAVGSALVGQDFSGDSHYFQGRISGVNYNTYTEEAKEKGTYLGAGSGGSNLAPSNEELQKRVEASVEEFLKAHPGVEKGDIPADLLTASGSGLDSDITPESAKIQISAISDATNLSEKELEQIVKEHTSGKILGIFGHERVNVLKCNLAIAAALEK